MALPYTVTGTVSRSGGLQSALIKQAKLINLKPVKKITFEFDPFGEDAVVVRNAVNYFYQDRIRDTNLKCALKTSLLANRAEPSIKVDLDDGKAVLFKTKNLQTLEILQKFNELISSQAKLEDKSATAPKTKLTKSLKRR